MAKSWGTMVFTRRICLCIAFIVLNQMQNFICGQNCNLKFTHPPINGYRCVTDFVTYRYTDNIKEIQPYTCVHQCIRRPNCSIATYKIKENTCLLSNNVCTLVEVDDSYQLNILIMTSSNGNIFRVTGHLCGKFTGHRWISHTKASDAELWCLLWSVPEWTIE